MTKMRTRAQLPRDMSVEEKYEKALALAKRGRRKHTKEVIPLLRAAADGGHPMAAHALATWYFFGIGLRKNFAIAVALEERAARSGIVEAIFNLAHAYETGEGVKKDQPKAVRLYRRAAALGDAVAAYEVGRCLYYGIGTVRNERLGSKWVKKSKDMKKTTKAGRNLSRHR